MFDSLRLAVNIAADQDVRFILLLFLAVEELEAIRISLVAEEEQKGILRSGCFKVVSVGSINHTQPEEGSLP